MIVNGKDRAGAIRLVSKARLRRPHLPVLSRVRLKSNGGDLVVEATDLGTLLRARVGCRGEIDALIQPEALRFIGRDEDVEIEQAGEACTVRAGEIRAEIPSLDLADWPTVREPEWTGALSLTASDIAEIGAAAAHACTDLTREVLCTVCRP